MQRSKKNFRCSFCCLFSGNNVDGVWDGNQIQGRMFLADGNYLGHFYNNDDTTGKHFILFLLGTWNFMIISTFSFYFHSCFCVPFAIKLRLDISQATQKSRNFNSLCSLKFLGCYFYAPTPTSPSLPFQTL